MTQIYTPDWAKQNARTMVNFIESRVCPNCGDTLHKRTCDNRSGTCGQDWNSIYHMAKHDSKVGA